MIPQINHDFIEQICIDNFGKKPKSIIPFYEQFKLNNEETISLNYGSNTFFVCDIKRIPVNATATTVTAVNNPETYTYLNQTFSLKTDLTNSTSAFNYQGGFQINDSIIFETFTSSLNTSGLYIIYSFIGFRIVF